MSIILAILKNKVFVEDAVLCALMNKTIMVEAEF
jgi:hypothetical protein